jgi:hypothetical protein
VRTFFTREKARRGTQLHALAHQLITLGVPLPDTTATLNRYVNDALGYAMTPEQTFYYSPNAFGHADTASLRGNKLRIHDLKTGEHETSFVQLQVYAALCCLEYRKKPSELDIELRIYQNDAVRIESTDPHTIFHIMDRITTFDRILNELRMEGA